MKKLEDMTIGQIIESFDFPDSFIEEFKTWCAAQPSDPSYKSSFRWSDLAIIENPFLDILEAPSSFTGAYLPIPVVDKKER